MERAQKFKGIKRLDGLQKSSVLKKGLRAIMHLIKILCIEQVC